MDEFKEVITEDDYQYEIPLEDCEIYISSGGVSVICEDGVLHTNITPESLFPNAKRLTPQQLQKILNILEQTGYEGAFLTPSELDIREVVEDEDFGV
jgi:hypothetical protein